MPTAENRRRIATPETIERAASTATVAEVSRQLIDRVYAISQAELAEVLEVQVRIAADKVRLEMLEAKVLLALRHEAPIQPGLLDVELAHKTVKASVSWKGIVEEHMGAAYAKAKLLEAQEAVRGKLGEAFARVFKHGA